MNPVEASQTDGSNATLRDQTVVVLIGVSTLIALLVRCYGLESQSLTNDEVVELSIARQSWSAVVTEADGFPPLSILIFKAAWLLSDNDMAGRWLSVIYGTLAVPILGLLTWRLANGKAGVIASGLLAINPLHVYFSQEGRSYALFFFVCAAAVWLFWKAIDDRSTRSWVAFAIVASVGGYVHYYFGFVLVAVGLIWLLDSFRTSRWLSGTVAFTAIGLAQLPLLLLVKYDLGCQQSMQQTFLSLEALGYTGWAWLTGFCVGPSLKELHEASLVSALALTRFWVLPLAAVTAYWLVGICRGKVQHRTELLILLFVPLTSACIAAWLLQVSYNVRYVVPCILPLIVGMAILLSCEPRKWMSVSLGLILLAVSMTSLLNRQLVAKYYNEDSRAAFSYLAAQDEANVPVYTIANYMGDSAEYYLPDEFEVVQIANIGADGEGLPAAIALLNRSETFWVFYCREFHGDPKRLLRQTLLDSPDVGLAGAWPGVELFRGSAPLMQVGE